METLNLVLFTALIVSFLVLFLAPGRWWPHHYPQGEREHREIPIPRNLLSPRRHTDDDALN